MMPPRRRYITRIQSWIPRTFPPGYFLLSVLCWQSGSPFILTVGRCAPRPTRCRQLPPPVPTDKGQHMKIGLLGYGTVGRQVAQLLKQVDCGIEVKKILRRPGKASGPLMTDSFDEILNDPDITCIAEVLSGEEPAKGYIRRALEAGKHVVTSNKAALAADFAPLIALAEEKNVKLMFEASCGGGMPWVEGVKKAARLDEITQITGILNGTCNYILDRMERMDMDFGAALAQAQQLGYAEADPTADISGTDVRNKAVISLGVGFHTDITRDFPVSGIEHLTKEILDSFHARGKRLRLMLIAERRGELYALGVVPIVLDAGSYEASIRDNFNFGRLTGDIVGPLSYFGQGAGGRPTADAVIQDLISIRNGSAENAVLGRTMIYDPAVLHGTGYFPDETVTGKTLAELVALAHEKQTFLAFEPEVLEN